MTNFSFFRGPLFSDRNFRAVWLVGILVGIVRWLELLALGIYAIEVTGSPFLVALLALLRFMPLALFGMFIGALADSSDSRLMLMIGLGLSCLTSLVMAGLFLLDVAQYWHVAVAAFLSGALWASDMPLRRKLVGEIAGLDQLARAMSIDTATGNGTRMLGPLFGGLIYQSVGAAGIYLIGSILYAASVWIMVSVRRPQTNSGAKAGTWIMRPLISAWRAIRYAGGNKEVLNLLGVTIVFNVWAFPVLSMVPVIAKDDLGLSASSIGAITALEGGCAFLGALLVARYAKARLYRRIYYYCTCAFLMMVLVIGTFPNLPMLASGLVGAGLAGAGFATMQSTLIYLVAPADMRGRLLGLITICIGSGLIGLANVGLLAELFGATTAVQIMALQGMIPMIIIGLRWTQLRGR